MKINHTVAHYVIGGTALVLAASANISPSSAPVHESAVHNVMKPSRFDWAALGQDKVIALGEALKGTAPGKVKIFSATEESHELALDFDDAFQIAGWQDEIEGRQVESENDYGIFVGPPGDAAEAFKAIIHKTTGIDPEIVPIDGIDGVGLIIGKTKR